MYKILILLLSLFITSSILCQSFSHFRIYADLKKETFFWAILGETALDDVFTDKFQMVVSTDPKNAFIVIGRYESPDVEWDRDAYRYDWVFLSRNLREKILKYKEKIIIR